MGTFHTAQICVNGHTITDSIEESPELCQTHCSTCGAGTVIACASCDSPIRGHYEVPGIVGLGAYSPPRFCYHCGLEYPWTRARLQAASALADELDGLSVDERAQLKGSIEDLATETPATEVAAVRVKKLLSKVGSTGADALRKLIVDIVSEATKKSLGL